MNRAVKRFIPLSVILLGSVFGASSDAQPDPLQTALGQRAPLFRKQIELSIVFAGMSTAQREDTITKIRAQYPSLQYFQRMEASIDSIGLATQSGLANSAGATDILASRLPSVAAAPTELLARQTMRIAVETIDRRLELEIASASDDIDLSAVRKNISAAR